MSAPLRIALLVTRSDVFGGAVIHVRDLALGLSAAGHDVRVHIGGHGMMVDRLRDAGIRVDTIPDLDRDIRPVPDARALRALVQALRRDPPDLLHAHTAKAGLLGRAAATIRGIPCVYTPHAWPFLDGVPPVARRIYLEIEHAAAHLPSSVVNVCRFEQREALAHRVGPPRRHFIVHNGVPDVPPRLQADPGYHPPHMVMIARFEPQKDHASLVRALAPLDTAPWTLDLIGDGPLRETCRGEVVAAGLSDRIRFPGEVDDVAERLSRAQLVVLTSHWEALPLTLLEAMRAGLPTVATDVGGVSEAVDDGLTGLLVPPGDVRALTTALARVVDDPGLRTSMGAAARESYGRRFTLDAMVHETTRVYRTTLARHAMGQSTHLSVAGQDQPARDDDRHGVPA